MDLADVIDRVDTIDVLIALFMGFVVWLGINSIGLRLLARNLSADTEEGKPRWLYATAQAGVRLLATLAGISAGIVSVWLITL